MIGRHLRSALCGWSSVRRAALCAALALGWTCRPAPAQAAQAGEIPIVRSIVVEGERRYREDEIRAALGQAIGQPLDVRAVDDGVRTLWDSLKVRARVLYRELPDGVELRVDVQEMAVDLEPRFTGNVEIKDKKLLEWAALEGREELFLFQAPRVQSRLLENYRREGFYWTEIDVVSRGSVDGSEPADVIFEIKEGPRVRVEEVRIHGNESLPDTGALWWADGLERYAKPKLKKAAWWKLRLRGSPFVQEELDADVLAIRDAYRERGWFDVVAEVQGLSFNRERDRVTIDIRIDEGEPYHVAKLGLRGYKVRPEGLAAEPEVAELFFDEQELLELCRLLPGKRFERALVQHDQRALRSFYGERGYLDHPSLDDSVQWHFLEPEIVFDVEKHTVEVTYCIVQGAQVDLREIRLQGNLHTRDKVVRSRISVFPGQRANQNEIEQSLRRISATGFFSDDFNPLDHPAPTFRFVPVEGDPRLVDLEFVVEEGRVVDANLAGGVDSNDGLFGVISLTMRNFDITNLPSSFFGMFGEIYRKEAFHGAGQRLDLEFSPGTEVSRWRTRLFLPDVFNTDLNPVGLDIDLNKRVRLFDNYDEDRFNGRLRLVRRFENDVFLALGLNYLTVDVSDLDTNVPPLLAEQEQEGRQDLIGPLIEFSRRDVDDLRVPHEGYSARWDSTVFTELVGSDVSMVSTRATLDLYRPVHENEDGMKHVLHAGVDGRLHVPYGPTDDAPYTERFQLGGRESLRGLGFRGVGPFDPVSGDPLGGETYLAGTFEYYVPLTSVARPDGLGRLESLRASLFLDWGVQDPDSFQLDLGELRVTTGFGVGLVFPLPLQLNFGFPLLSEDGDDQQVLSFSFSLE